MNLDRGNLENADIMAVTGVSAAILQTWANRGILFADTDTRPGAGQKRLYSRLDAARIAVIKNLVECGLSASTASQIAYRLERAPQTATSWRNALEQTARHIYLFIDGTDVLDVYAGDDAGEVGRRITAFTEPIAAGTMGRGIREETQTQIKAAVYDIGPEVSKTLLQIDWRRRYEISFTAAGGLDGQVQIRVIATPGFAGGKNWYGTFAATDLLNDLRRTFALNDAELDLLRAQFSCLTSGQITFSSTHSPSGSPPISVFPEDSLIELGLTEDYAFSPEARALGQSLLEHHRTVCRNINAPTDLVDPQATGILIRYGVLCERAGLPSLTRSSGNYLQEIAVWCRKEGWPPINALVVNKSGLPGGGYDPAPGGGYAQWPEQVRNAIAFTGYPPVMPR